MSVVLFVVGLFMDIFVLYDVLSTVFGDGAGYMTRHVLKASTMVIHITEKVGGKIFSSQPFGCMTLLTLQLMWYSGLWLSWTLMFYLQEDALVPKQTAFVSVPAQIYFTGFTLFSLGIGDYYIRPEYHFLLLWSILCTAQGLFIVIVSVSYFCGALSSAAQSKSLAEMIILIEPLSESLIQNESNLKVLASSLIDGIRTELQSMNDYPVLLPFLVNAKEEWSLIDAMMYLKTLVTVFEMKHESYFQELYILKRVIDLYGDQLEKQTQKKITLDETLFRKLMALNV